MPYFLLKLIGKYDTTIKTHDMVLSNYEGKIGHTLRVIQIDMTMGSINIPTAFMDITSRPSYNLLLGWEWIYGIGAVP